MFIPDRYLLTELPTPVAQTCSLLYRRVALCQTAVNLGAWDRSDALPITNRRYGRLKICATVNTCLPWGEDEPFSPQSTIQPSRISTAQCALSPLFGERVRVRGNGANHFLGHRINFEAVELNERSGRAGSVLK